MTIPANTIAEYLQNVPQERQSAFHQLRQTILQNIPEGFQETLQYGMIGYVVPLTTYPSGYHAKPSEPLPFAHIASQKNFIALYHSGIYADPDIHQWFTTEYPKHAKRKLDMGKSCIRFKKMDDIPYDLIAQLLQKITVQDWITRYETTLKNTKKTKTK